MSSEQGDALITAVGESARQLQSAVDAMDEAVAVSLGINRTDLRCLDELLRIGEGGPASLARLLGLTSGSMTAVLDRLEQVGYITRSPDPADRRKLVVRPTPAVLTVTTRLYWPLAEEGARAMSEFSPEQLQVILRYLEVSLTLLRTHTQRVRSGMST